MNKDEETAIRNVINKKLLKKKQIQTKEQNYKKHKTTLTKMKDKLT